MFKKYLVDGLRPVNMNMLLGQRQLCQYVDVKIPFISKTEIYLNMKGIFSNTKMVTGKQVITMTFSQCFCMISTCVRKVLKKISHG